MRGFTQYVRLLIVISAATVCAFAQTPDIPRGDIFIAYSYTSANLGAGGKFGLNGFAVSGDHNLKPWLAIAYKEDSYWGSATFPFCYSSSSCVAGFPNNTAHLDTIMGGVRLATNRGRFTPFARALAGVGFLFGCVQPGCESKAGYAQDFSAGVQGRITERRLGWRFEAGLMETHLFGGWQNDFRISTGPVIYFYPRK